MWRRYFSQNVIPAVANETGGGNLLEKLGISWILDIAPAFYLKSKNIQILQHPTEFYRLLFEQIEGASYRITLSSLYIGTGILEEKLLTSIKDKLSKKNDIRVKFLLDCTRGSRGEINSRKMLLPLLQKYRSSCQVHLYQTPSLQNPLIQFLPAKYKEILGLHHIKVYLFDDNLIITGANLSSDYFTNRQDRYIIIRNSKKLCDFIEGLLDKISDFSYCLKANDTLEFVNSNNFSPSQTDPKTFNFAASNYIKKYYEDFVINVEDPSNHDTVIFPLLEMGPFNIHIDSTITTKLLEKCDSESTIYLTTGYFNLTDAYKKTIIDRSKAKFKILMAHPTANGFYKANFPAGGVPHAYTYLASKFLNEIEHYHQGYRIKLFEYKKRKWTYHAKGLWITTPDFELPSITMIGSSNFGDRSVKRDLECQFLLATTNESLQYDLMQERQSLYDSSVIFTELSLKELERDVPAWVKSVVYLFKSYL